MDRQNCVSECFASIKSLQRVKRGGLQNTKITIYTNRTEDFYALDLSKISISIEFRQISEVQRSNWIGEKRYVFRPKICALIDFLESGKDYAMFVDTDTFFLQDSDSLFEKLSEPNTVVMNYAEHRLPQVCKHRFFFDLYQSKTINTKDKTFEFDDSLQFWNSGIVGVRGNALDILYDSLLLCDAIWEKYGLFTSEQAALSCAFWQRYRIATGDDIIFHYWFMKEARYLVEAALNIPSSFENKHMNTPVVKYLKNGNEKIEVSSLVGLIRMLFLNMKRNFVQNVYGTINENTNLGRMIRE